PGPFMASRPGTSNSSNQATGRSWRSRAKQASRSGRRQNSRSERLIWSIVSAVSGVMPPSCQAWWIVSSVPEAERRSRRGRLFRFGLEAVVELHDARPAVAPFELPLGRAPDLAPLPTRHPVADHEGRAHVGLLPARVDRQALQCIADVGESAERGA